MFAVAACQKREHLLLVVWGVGECRVSELTKSELSMVLSGNGTCGFVSKNYSQYHDKCTAKAGAIDPATIVHTGITTSGTIDTAIEAAVLAPVFGVLTGTSMSWSRSKKTSTWSTQP